MHCTYSVIVAIYNVCKRCMIWSSHSDAAEDMGLLGCEAVLLDDWFSMLQRNVFTLKYQEIFNWWQSIPHELNHLCIYHSGKPLNLSESVTHICCYNSYTWGLIYQRCCTDRQIYHAREYRKMWSQHLLRQSTLLLYSHQWQLQPCCRHLSCLSTH
jgi:hypothetical protein